MKKSTKAVLLSGLVFPGLGHVYLRKYAVGLALLCLAGWSIYSVSETVVATAMDVANEIESGSVAIDSTSISQLVEQRSQETEQSTNVPMLLLLASWLIGIIDSYRAGRAQDLLDKSTKTEKT